VTENSLTLVKVNVDEPKALELVQKYQVLLRFNERLHLCQLSLCSKMGNM